METPKMSFLDNVVQTLKSAASELEEFQLQLALGKAEAADKYEEVKKKFNETIHDFKVNLEESKNKPVDLFARLEALQTLLSPGKITDKEAFKAQKVRIISAILEVETLLKMTELGAALHSKISDEIHKFRIKLEILSLRFELGKMDVKEEFNEKKEAFNAKINNFKQKFSDTESEIKKDWEKLNDEVVEVYQHFKKAFTL